VFKIAVEPAISSRFIKDKKKRKIKKKAPLPGFEISTPPSSTAATGLPPTFFFWPSPSSHAFHRLPAQPHHQRRWPALSTGARTSRGDASARQHQPSIYRLCAFQNFEPAIRSRYFKITLYDDMAPRESELVSGVCGSGVRIPGPSTAATGLSLFFFGPPPWQAAVALPNAFHRDEATLSTAFQRSHSRSGAQRHCPTSAVPNQERACRGRRDSSAEDGGNCNQKPPPEVPPPSQSVTAFSSSLSLSTLTALPPPPAISAPFSSP
jgi:hypothetical protein